MIRSDLMPIRVPSPLKELPMNISHSLEISASGLTAERLRMDVISENLANINTTRTADGTPYRRKHVIFESDESGSASFASSLLRACGGDITGGGVRVAAIEKDNGPFKRVYDPGHPDAGPDGYVLMPNVEPVMEMVDLITATRAFDAGVTAIGAAKQMQQKALDIGKG
jgi:flagellar basal-body rod protein FlgC